VLVNLDDEMMDQKALRLRSFFLRFKFCRHDSLRPF
jgi:hypothetical protein